MTRAKNGAGTQFWRVRLGKKFTGGQSVKKEFPDLDSARVWIKDQTEQQEETGASTFQLSPAQLWFRPGSLPSVAIVCWRGPARGAPRLDQRPTLVSFTIERPAVASQIHTPEYASCRDAKQPAVLHYAPCRGSPQGEAAPKIPGKSGFLTQTAEDALACGRSGFRNTVNS